MGLTLSHKPLNLPDTLAVFTACGTGTCSNRCSCVVGTGTGMGATGSGREAEGCCRLGCPGFIPRRGIPGETCGSCHGNWSGVRPGGQRKGRAEPNTLSAFCLSFPTAAAALILTHPVCMELED